MEIRRINKIKNAFQLERVFCLYSTVYLNFNSPAKNYF